MPLDRITLLCFGASYAVALALEIVQLFWPRMVQRLLANLFGGAGVLAHTLYLVVQRPALSSHFGSLLFLALVLAVFNFSGSIHHRRITWGVFVLPLVLGLTLLAATFPRSDGVPTAENDWESLRGESFWGSVHGWLLLLAAVGICVGFVASVMYLVQTRRLRTKTLPGPRLRLMSLERLERMNRWAINLAFPLLTAGVCVGIGLMFLDRNHLLSWADPQVLGAAVLWLVFALLLYMRYGVHLTGRRLAQLTIVAFVLMMFTLASSHAFVREVVP
jgi:ABC-type transport system involved in cytochrome c biogenesis permease subunit